MLWAMLTIPTLIFIVIPTSPSIASPTIKFLNSSIMLGNSLQVFLRYVKIIPLIDTLTFLAGICTERTPTIIIHYNLVRFHVTSFFRVGMVFYPSKLRKQQLRYKFSAYFLCPLLHHHPRYTHQFLMSLMLYPT